MRSKNPLNFVNNFASLSAELTDELGDALTQATLAGQIRSEVDELTSLLKENLNKIVQHGGGPTQLSRTCCCIRVRVRGAAINGDKCARRGQPQSRLSRCPGGEGRLQCQSHARLRPAEARSTSTRTKSTGRLSICFPTGFTQCNGSASSKEVMGHLSRSSARPPEISARQLKFGFVTTASAFCPM